MRTRNALERLAALAPTEPQIDAGDEERILQRILASDQSVVGRRRRPIAVVLVAAAVVGAAIAAYATHGRANPSVAASRGEHHVALTGQRIQLAGFRFRTPAGYASSESCPQPATSLPGSPNTIINSMQSAASADGGCLHVAILDRSWTPPAEAQAVSVGSYSGFFVAPANIPQEALFVQIPAAQGGVHFLIVAGQGLTENQLIAIAESGLPDSSGTTTCTADCG